MVVHVHMGSSGLSVFISGVYCLTSRHVPPYPICHLHSKLSLSIYILLIQSHIFLRRPRFPSRNYYSGSSCNLTMWNAKAPPPHTDINTEPMGNKRVRMNIEHWTGTKLHVIMSSLESKTTNFIIEFLLCVEVAGRGNSRSIRPCPSAQETSPSNGNGTQNGNPNPAPRTTT